MNSTFTLRLLSRGSKAILQQRPIITARSISILKNSRSANPVKITFNGIKPSKLNQLNQVRAIQTLDFGGVKEQVHERSDWPKEKFQKLFENDTIAIIGYGPQGRGQSLNAKDNGLNVIVGLREGGRSWKLALEDGWVPGKNLFNINDALSKGTIIGNLLSDAAQKELWPQFTPHLTKGKTIYFSHGFSIVYKEETNVIPPKDIDVIMIAPKGSGRTVRSQFLDGRGINSSFAVYQDATGKARDRCVALGIAIGSGYLYETDFKKEVFSDLFGERGVLMGAIQGLFLAQYEVLRERGHTPSEAFNETVEEATQSLYPLVGENGMDWMYAACSTTAQRGALDWYKPFHDATKPVFEKLYASVADGTETRRTLEKNSSPKYREELEEELREIRESEIWRAGKTVRSLRPEAKNK
ncbi:ketol-acid reductoisomerase [Gigaspora rosea]|uniref:ketol-acid reductoisomerase (NADP(+)) n=1 Tax=Gigaspora rosea TaxID=44941 RepID=A0A397UTY5_9GLOM|nr:ketol-acid reductoisomerase [Gigaspora rosea]